MTHRANSLTESHGRCPTPHDCVCACPACLMARADYIEGQQRRPAPSPPAAGTERMGDAVEEMKRQLLLRTSEVVQLHDDLRRAREEEERTASFEKAFRRAVEIIVGTPAAEQSSEAEDLLLALTTCDARLRKEIEDAPHGPGCDYGLTYRGLDGEALERPRCNCWKARALGKEGA